MKKILLLVSLVALFLTAGSLFLLSDVRTEAAAPIPSGGEQDRVVYGERFDIQVLVDGRPLDEYYANGKVYIEALRGTEYEIRIRNPLPIRVAVALSVDGLNSIDARRTTAWNASKWVIGPYQTITIGGWQMSSDRARRFYFTSESDSYAAKLGQTSNLGLISAVFFRERSPRPVTIMPRPRPRYEDRETSKRSDSQAPSSTGQGIDKDKSRKSEPMTDDEYAATGIGRSVQNDVRWVDMDLETRSVGEAAIRYEYYSALVRLGVRPRPYTRIEPLPRRERATGFEDRRFSPEP
jgi:hypothetical protein